MLNRCPGCGGTLRFNIAGGYIECDFCRSKYEPDSYIAETRADEEEGFFEASVLKCPNCGAEITATEAAAVEYCLYCGSFVTLESHLENIRRPDTIIPFQVTEEDCRSAYKRSLRTKLYAPKEFKDESFLKGFKSIYIPYWTYEYSYGPKVSYETEVKKRRGDYVHTTKYEIEQDASGSADDICFDASSSFDDEISSRVAPFSYEKMRPFNPSYMFGLFADTADVPEAQYSADAADSAYSAIWNTVTSHAPKKNGTPKKQSHNVMDNTFNIRRDVKLSMLPVWFLTWKKGDRVAYSVVNGESGKVYAEVPVDTRKYLLFSLILAVPIFFLLNFLFTLTGTRMLILSLVLSFLMIVLYVKELERIVKRELHINDRGYLFKNKDAATQKAAYRPNVFSEFKEATGEFLRENGIFMVILACIALLALGEVLILLIPVLIVAIPVYTVIRIGKCAKYIKDKTVWLDILGAAFALIYSGVTLIIDPAHDNYYYIGAVISMAAIGITAIRTMKRYNSLVTRPIPHFFERTKGGKE
ncbi:MAG: hypothetical protein Q4B67_08905 [Eubacteriales bacterium]|nr:hypothetical protein [Eubacteriales bacterium]